jgi:superoxide dismutase, Fe-Mn family
MHHLPDLPYSYDALEPHIDAKTMEIHHTKHHQGYIDKLNTALETYEDLNTLPLDQLMSKLDEVPQDIYQAVRNNGGGHANHSLFWTILTPKPTKPTGPLAQAIKSTFGSLDDFKTAFSAEAAGRFGSGWAWLTLEAGSLHVCSTPNQDNPLMEGNTPLLGLDVWEHAYYLKYQNRRADYIEAFWNLVNWPQVADNYVTALDKS